MNSEIEANPANLQNTLSHNTDRQYFEVISACRNIFLKKIGDYGTSWRVMRPSSLTDQIFIKAQRIKNIESYGIQKVDEGIEPEFMGIINYGLMGLIQLEQKEDLPFDLTPEEAEELYNAKVQITFKVMSDKNHDYGEAWRDMRVSSFTDLILMKLMRIKQIEDNEGTTEISEGIDSHYTDIVNYAIFAMIKLNENAETD